MMLLSNVCLSVAYIGPNSRTERPRKTKIGRGSPRHVTRTPLSRSKVKGQGHQAALLSAALTRKAAAAVSVETFGVGKYCYVASAQQRANGGGEGQGHIVSPHAQLVTDKLGSLSAYSRI